MLSQYTPDIVLSLIYQATLLLKQLSTGYRTSLASPVSCQRARHILSSMLLSWTEPFVRRPTSPVPYNLCLLTKVQVPTPSCTFLPHGTQLVIPKTLLQCEVVIPHSLNRHHRLARIKTARWFLHGSGLSGNQKDTFLSVRAAVLASRFYPTAAYPQLRVCTDFLSWLSFVDDITDNMNERGTQAAGADVLNALWHPDNYMPISKVASMAKE